MAVNGMGPMDPNAYAQKYAQQKGISVEQAKQELRATHGDPQQPQGADGLQFGGNSEDSIQRPSSFDGSSFSTKDFDSDRENIEKELKKLGIPEDVIKEGDDAIRKFAEENDIKIPRKIDRKLD